MNRITHFEVHAADPERAAAFYSNVFGWDINEWVIPEVEIPDENRYWLIGTGPDDKGGINGGMLVRQGPAPEDGQPVNAYTCIIEVESADDIIQKVPSEGGMLTVPKMAVPGMGWVAYFKDTEGNIFGIMEPDPEAA